MTAKPRLDPDDESLAVDRALQRIDRVVEVVGGSGDDRVSFLSDILVDLRHFAFEHGEDFEEAVERSEMHFDEEQADRRKKEGIPERLGGKPRASVEDAYATFMDMSDREWLGLRSLVSNGVLTPIEQAGFRRALVDRPKTAS